MKNAASFWATTILLAVLLSGCAVNGRFVSFDQPEIYIPGEPITVSFQADSVTIFPLIPQEGCVTEWNISPAASDSWTPVVHVVMPENWKLAGCELTGEYPPIDEDAAAKPGPESLRSTIEAVKAIREAYGMEIPPGYKEELAELPFGMYDPLEAKCVIVPGSGCGRAELTYGIYSKVNEPQDPAVMPAEVADCDKIYEDWLLQEKIVVSRAIECHRMAVPAVAGWGILVMGVMLAGFGVRHLLRRKRTA